VDFGLLLLKGTTAVGGFARGPFPIVAVSVLMSSSDHPSFGSSLSNTGTGCAMRLILDLRSFAGT